VKQNLYLLCHRVDSTEVWAFVQIAAVASEREIPDIVAAAVLTGDNVFDLMRHRAILLAKLAVLASVVSRKQADNVHFLGKPPERRLQAESPPHNALSRTRRRIAASAVN
jgi:hypothetical protein